MRYNLHWKPRRVPQRSNSHDAHAADTQLEWHRARRAVALAARWVVGARRRRQRRQVRRQREAGPAGGVPSARDSSAPVNQVARAREDLSPSALGARWHAAVGVHVLLLARFIVVVAAAAVLLGRRPADPLGRRRHGAAAAAVREALLGRGVGGRLGRYSTGNDWQASGDGTKVGFRPRP